MKGRRNHHNDSDQEDHIGPLDAIFGGHGTSPPLESRLSLTITRPAYAEPMSASSPLHGRPSWQRTCHFSPQPSLPSSSLISSMRGHSSLVLLLCVPWHLRLAAQPLLFV